jgi:hypothetical protein
MPFYNFYAKLDPEWIFGIPCGTDLITPTGSKPYFSVEGGSMKPIKHSTLPLYRKEEEKISLRFDTSGVNVEFNDNFVYLKFDAIDEQRAYEKAYSIMDNLALSMSLTTFRKFSFELISGYEMHAGEAVRTVSIPQTLTWSFKSYNLEQLTTQITQSIKVAFVENDVLRKSLEYFDHAMFLDQIQTKYGIQHSDQIAYLLADMILSLNKCVTVITGEKADKRYQTNLEQLGFKTDDWEERISSLNKIRNKWDVAHPRVSKEKILTLRSITVEAFDLARSVIIRYSEYISEGAPL